jgi:hypothetical protein
LSYILLTLSSPNLKISHRTPDPLTILPDQVMLENNASWLVFSVFPTMFDHRHLQRLSMILFFFFSCSRITRSRSIRDRSSLATGPSPCAGAVPPSCLFSSFRGPVRCSRPAPNEPARPAQVQLSVHGRNGFGL